MDEPDVEDYRDDKAVRITSQLVSGRSRSWFPVPVLVLDPVPVPIQARPPPAGGTPR